MWRVHNKWNRWNRSTSYGNVWLVSSFERADLATGESDSLVLTQAHMDGFECQQALSIDPSTGDPTHPFC